MKKNIAIIVLTLGLVAFAIFTITNYNHPNSNLDQNIADLIESGRQEGYNQAYLELSYGIGSMPNVSDECYNNYLEAKDNYEKNKNEKNFEELVKATQQVLKNK